MYEDASIRHSFNSVNQRDLALSCAPNAVAAMAEDDGRSGNAHDLASRSVLLSQISAFLGVPVRSPMTMAEAADAHVLLVPSDTVVAKRAEALPATSILGGVVPAAFVATKAITHGLIHSDANHPDGWSMDMARLMGDAAIQGFTAFSIEDARHAGRKLLDGGPVRIKDVCGKAGLGQYVVQDEVTLDSILEKEDPAAIARCGIVLEANLTNVMTYSVGTVTLGGRQISYWGSQNLTQDHHGRDVYGGSDLCVIRGGWEKLLALELPSSIARAVECAAIFDDAAQAAYPDIQLSRRNYDVIEGTDHQGHRRIAALEQSWRVGGASGAEIAAFLALDAEPELASVRCSTVEVYGMVEPPHGATLYYQGEDPRVGAMTKYAMRLV